MLTALINIRQTNKNQKKTKPKNANCAQKGSEAKITIQMTNFFRNLMATPEKNERHHTDEAQQQQNNGAQYDEPWLLDDIWTMVFVDGGLVTAAAWMSTWRCHQMCWVHCQCHLIFCFFFLEKRDKVARVLKNILALAAAVAVQCTAYMHISIMRCAGAACYCAAMHI